MPSDCLYILIFIELRMYFPTMLCCMCRDTFPCPLLFMSLILADSFCSFSVSLPINNFFCQQSLLLFCSCLFMFMLNITSPGRAPLQICVHGRLFVTVLIFVFILILVYFNQIFICKVFIYYPMDAQFIYRVLVEDGCFLESLDCLSPIFLNYVSFDSVKNSSGLKRQERFLQGKKKEIPALKNHRIREGFGV